MKGPHLHRLPMKKIKFLYRGRSENGDQLWLRQFPGCLPKWGDCEFVFDRECREYDWLVVYDDLPPSGEERFSRRVELLACPKENSLLITSEPSTIKVYGRGYTKQFGHVLTTQEPWVIRHPSAIHSQCGFRWFYGIGSNGVKSFDDMALNPPVVKDGLISTVCSHKKQKNTVHAKRFEFTQALKMAIPEMEVFGRGVREIDDKAEALDRFKYHVVIENHCGRDHWSEKLADAFLGHTLPLYYGCSNVTDYFPEDSIIRIDPYRESESIEIIKKAIEANEYEKRIHAISEARNLVMERYNVFAELASIVGRTHEDHQVSPGAEKATIASRRKARDKSLFTSLGYYLERYSVKWRHRWSPSQEQESGKGD